MLQGCCMSFLTIRVGPGITPPDILFKVEPLYSEPARKAKYSGNVVLFVIVEHSGKPSHITVVKALGLGLDEKAIEAVEQWRFKAGLKDGKAVSVEATISINFHLL